MNSKRSLVWLFITMWIVTGAVPSSAMCTCGQKSVDNSATCCSTKDAPPQSCCCSAPGRKAPTSKQDAPGSAAVSHAGCLNHPPAQTAFTIAPRAGQDGLSPQLTPQPRVALETPRPEPWMSQVLSAPGSARLLTNVYRL